MSKAYDETKRILKQQLETCSGALIDATDAMLQIDVEAPSSTKRYSQKAAEALLCAYRAMATASFYMSRLAILHSCCERESESNAK